MPVFTDAHAHDVAGIFLQQIGVAAAFGLRISGGRIDGVDCFERHAVEQISAQEISEALRRIGRKPDVFIHMECIDLCEIDRLVGNQMREELVLARRGGKNHIDLAFFRNRRLDCNGRFFCCGFAHFFAGRIYAYV